MPFETVEGWVDSPLWEIEYTGAPGSQALDGCVAVGRPFFQD